MRKKNTDIMDRIIAFADEFHREYGRSPSTTEIAIEVGVARGTALQRMILILSHFPQTVLNRCE